MQSSLCLQFTSRVVPSKPIAAKAKALAQAAQRTNKVPDRPDDRVAHAFNGHEERGRRRSRSASPRPVGRVASRANGASDGHEERGSRDTKLCIKIHNRGRFHAGVQPLSRMPNASSLGIAAFQAAMKEYEPDEQTETDEEDGYLSEVEPASAAAPVPAPSVAM
ncbi:hypothetical protein DFH09DRAFT_1316722 [Mycena vulgaris]|nr:hypothetical protein DFH09DRAFT_1316722 [Mycena vulgaris]